MYYGFKYEDFRKGFLIFSSIKSETKEILQDIRIYNGNVFPKFKNNYWLNRNRYYEGYEFNKADIILTDYSIVFLGMVPLWSGSTYKATIELIYNE